MFLFFFSDLRIKFKFDTVSSVFPDLETIKFIDFILGSSLIWLLRLLKNLIGIL